MAIRRSTDPPLADFTLERYSPIESMQHKLDEQLLLIINLQSQLKQLASKVNRLQRDVYGIEALLSAIDCKVDFEG